MGKTIYEIIDKNENKCNQIIYPDCVRKIKMKEE